MIQYPDTPGYFNPRSHEGSDFSPTAVNVLVSNFNPRSHEGSDDVLMTYATEIQDFNPRSHEGSDLATVSSTVSAIISIHAPTRGATFIATCLLSAS